jgi:hypothetical protein
MTVSEFTQARPGDRTDRLDLGGQSNFERRPQGHDQAPAEKNFRDEPSLKPDQGK